LIMALLKEIAPKYNNTYVDFLEWDEDFRAELHDGEVVMMAPPLTKHQQVCGELFFQIRSYLEGKSCKVFPTPFGVRLFPKKDRSDNTVFEPDIVVICDQEKLDEHGCNGPPDFVIEIISPSTAKYDRVYKLRKYEKAGVREYWIVDPETKSVQVLLLKTAVFWLQGTMKPKKPQYRYLKAAKLICRRFLRSRVKKQAY
jgi:Uma2 family endonuclease